MKHSPGSEWDELDADDQELLLQNAIRPCAERRVRVGWWLNGQEYYAYPQATGSIAWGINRASDGRNDKRGVIWLA